LTDQVKTSGTRHIGILLFDDAEELDAVGPWEVLSSWTRYLPDDGFAVSCISQAGGRVRCAKGLVLQAHHSYTDAPTHRRTDAPTHRRTDAPTHRRTDAGSTGVPRWPGHPTQLRDEAQLDWVRRQRQDVPLMTSVCTGSLVYAAAGLLANRPATTHWGSLEHLAELDPTIDVRGEERFVDDGDVVTSAGVSAGIDMALHLVMRLAGVERARQVRRVI
jgi:transcriptional regulator GlxA family with amidase domain